MSVGVIENQMKILIRRDSKDPCYSVEMRKDLSVTNIEDGPIICQYLHGEVGRRISSNPE